MKNVSRVRRESNVGRIHSGLMPHFSPSVIQEFCILIPSSYKNQGMCSFIQKAFQLSSQKYTWHFIRFTYNKQKRVFSCFKYNSIFSIKYWFCISLRIRQSVRMKWKYIIKSSFFQLFCLFHFTRKKIEAGVDCSIFFLFSRSSSIASITNFNNFILSFSLYLSFSFHLIFSKPSLSNEAFFEWSKWFQRRVKEMEINKEC